MYWIVSGYWLYLPCHYWGSTLPSRDSAPVWRPAWEGSSSWSVTPAPSTHLPLLHLIAFCSSPPVFNPGLISQPLAVRRFSCLLVSVCSAVGFPALLFFFGPTPSVEFSNLCVNKCTLFNRYCGRSLVWTKHIQCLLTSQNNCNCSHWWLCWLPNSRRRRSPQTWWDASSLFIKTMMQAGGNLIWVTETLFTTVRLKRNLFMKTNLVCVQPLAPYAPSLLNT